MKNILLKVLFILSLIVCSQQSLYANDISDTFRKGMSIIDDGFNYVTKGVKRLERISNKLALKIEKKIGVQKIRHKLGLRRSKFDKYVLQNLGLKKKKDARKTYHKAIKETEQIETSIDDNLEEINQFNKVIQRIKDSGDEYLIIKGSSKVLISDLYKEYKKNASLDDFILNTSVYYFRSIDYSYSMFGLYKKLNNQSLNICLENNDLENMIREKRQALEDVEDCIMNNFNSEGYYVFSRSRLQGREEDYMNLVENKYLKLIKKLESSIKITLGVPMKLEKGINGVRLGFIALKREIKDIQKELLSDLDIIENLN